MDIQSPLKIIQFIRGGELVSLANVPPSRTLLEVLREDLGLTGTKEGCGEGDCGACTVVVGQAEGGRMAYRAVNSCIKLAHSLDGQALWTVEDLAATDGSLHPAQEAMVQCHGSQCGFCTPGFVMSLFGMYQNHVCQGKAITRELAQQDLSGNLCRCTGYRPILDAAQQMAALPPVKLDEADLLSKLELLTPTSHRLDADLAYKSPRSLAALLEARAAHPEAQLVAGCTDVGLWVTKMHRQFDQVLDITQVQELRHVEHYPHHIAIGAAVTLSDAFAALVADRPQLQTFTARFAGLPVRNAGTLGGNVANGSPIGDSMPLLIALGASVVLMSQRGHRELPLEALYTGYRKNVMAPDEVLAWVKVPKPERPHPLPGGEGKSQRAPAPSPLRGGEEEEVNQSALAPSPLRGEGWGEGQELLRVYKISKRYDDDISAVCLAVNLQIEAGAVARASIGAGGVAATPVRALQTEAALTGQPWTLQTVQQAINTLRTEFSPISDMRASGAYRSEVLGNLLQRFWLESQGLQQINLESFVLEEVTP
ncbi:MAG: FAD binding domain-containing protein [Polaromonas sp.]|uniref:xanthine dehydrogenase small subunit n=1 Tax=Polaromonas sp. TaxID=1869339 RepID=UPI0027346DCD|nr:FAD binding domain-containing protein [Polaromonas sp.]MDP2816933.1 FAD binding domain-containing protein [Polaromonas sp.]